MRTFLLFGLLFGLLSQNIWSQKVFSTEYAHQADLRVFVVDYAHQVKGNEGLWFFTAYPHQADKLVFFVDHAHQADLQVYFVDYAHQAHWRTASKKHLMFR